jgi:hypothetical protein
MLRLNPARIALLTGLVFVASACEFCDDDGLSGIPDPEDQIDVFDQDEAARVDILWVIDNSESMAAEQLKIAGRFSEFFRQLLISQVDYHVGVVTTDPDDLGELRQYDGTAVQGCDSCRYLTKDVGCSNPDVDVSNQDAVTAEQTLLSECHAQAVFRRLVTAGIDGSSFEEGFTQAATALGGNVIDPATGFPTGEFPAANDGFLRDDASLYIVFVSDENEGAKQDGAPVRYYQRLFEALKGAGNENLVSVSAITGWPRPDVTPDVPTVEELCSILTTTFDNNPGTDDPEAALVKAVMTGEQQDYTGCEDAAASGEANAFAETGSRYIELACRTGGVVANMCEEDYSTALDRLGANAAGLLRKFVLSKADEINAGTDCELFTDDDPVLDCDDDGSMSGDLDGPICVSARAIGSDEGSENILPRDPVSGWAYERTTNSVRFDGNFVPAPGSTITIRYKLRLPGGPSCDG